MDPVALSYLPLVSPVATLVVVVLGVFFSNRHVDVRISDLRAYIDVRIGAIDARIGAEARVNEANFKMLFGKIEDVDTRLTRLEERFAR
ncbi:MAG TPA: hypothetical protein VNY05_43980 [Candidatus Acidoferrales bacterium]|jgi:hypothetical protein|nr:hypothetical protein [Candidatus Acidoferrales bacterium]